jgi:phosphate transport system permease protein
MSVATGSVPPVGSNRAAPAEEIQLTRRVRNRLWWGFCTIGLLLLISPVVWILGGVIGRGVSTWHWSVLWTPEKGTAGGLANNIVGTLVITFGVSIIAAVVGIGCGTFLSEFGRPGIQRTILRSAYEILSGIPSIVFGYVGFVALVVGLHWSYSLLAALIVLSMLVVPYVAKSTEIALNQVPTEYREGAEALGMAKSYLMRKIVLKAAIPGMITGLVVAIAISVGETAPLLYTAGTSIGYPTGALTHSPVGYLTYVVFADYDSPFKSQHALSNDAAMLLLILVILILLGSRLIVRVTQKYSPNRALSASKSRRSGRHRRGRTVSGAEAVIAQAAVGGASHAPGSG